MKERIKKLRKALGLTQQEFADRLGMKRNTIANYETGRNDPSNSVISLISREFNVNESWIRSEEGEMFLQISRDQEIAEFIGKALSTEEDTFKKRFIAMLSRLDESDWEVLERMALDLAGQKKED